MGTKDHLHQQFCEVLRRDWALQAEDLEELENWPQLEWHQFYEQLLRLSKRRHSACHLGDWQQYFLDMQRKWHQAAEGIA